MTFTASRSTWLAGGAVSLALIMGCTSGGVPGGRPDVSPRLATSASSVGTSTQRVPLKQTAVKWRRVASGINTPTQVTSAPDGRKRLFVVQKPGSILIVRHGKIAGTPYLRINGRVNPGGEGGLLSVAFSPSFRKDGLLWVAFTRHDGDLVIARMRARNATAKRVRSSTLRPILRVEHSQNDNHFGGQLAFGSHHRLYIGTGDGGSAGDPPNNAQQRSDLRGKILRINPYGHCHGKPYCVPKSNPFVGKKGRDIIWLMGLRNPWRFSFDHKTDNLWIGDVGQDAYEEIDRIGPHPQRINLGWSCKEGRATYRADRCHKKAHYRGPVTTVPHPAGESIIGGFVYRGHRYHHRLAGTYVFGDFITHRVWLYRPGTGKVAQPQRLGNGAGPTSFGVDDRGEIYAVTYDGVLWRMRVVRR